MADPPFPDADDDIGVGPDRDVRMPRWVWVSGIVALVVVLLVVIMMLIDGGGEHGPGRHTTPSDGGGQSPPASINEGHVPPAGGHG